MKRKLNHSFLFIIISLITVSIIASSAVFASVMQGEENLPSRLESVSPKSSRVEMRVCTESMPYYLKSDLSGTPISTIKFGRTVYAEKEANGIMCIYNKNGVLLGYCKETHLVSGNAQFFAEIPQQWSDDGKVSNLVDLRKYIIIFESNIICGSDKPVLVQYDTAMKLFDIANELTTQYEYILCVDAAYAPEPPKSDEPSEPSEPTDPSAPSDPTDPSEPTDPVAPVSEPKKCCETCSHSTGAVITLSLLKIGSDEPERIPVYEDDFITDDNTQNGDASENGGSEAVTAEEKALSELTRLFADHSLIRDGETDCFYDENYESYMSINVDMSSLIYSVWE